MKRRLSILIVVITVLSLLIAMGGIAYAYDEYATGWATADASTDTPNGNADVSNHTWTGGKADCNAWADGVTGDYSIKKGILGQPAQVDVDAIASNDGWAGAGAYARALTGIAVAFASAYAWAENNGLANADADAIASGGGTAKGIAYAQGINVGIADDQGVGTDEDTPVGITLTGSDVDGDGLTFTIVAGPSNGILSGSAPNVTYTPSSGYDGSDSFTFKANDGEVDSNNATVSITVSAATPAAEEFSFFGNIGKEQEKRHIVTVSSPGATSMSVKLTWSSGWSDLVLRVYDPSGVLVKEVDQSAWGSASEETTISGLGSGDWQVAAYAKRTWGSMSYTLEGVVNY